MNSQNTENEPAGGTEAPETNQQKLAILNLFRLLESAVQTTQFKLGGQIVVQAQDVVGGIVSAKSELESGHPAAAIQGLRQAAESFRYKSVRWESEARAAQSGKGTLTAAQKKQLPAEISAVRTTSRKTLIFFERLSTELAEWANIVQPDYEQSDGATAAEKTEKSRNAYQRAQVAYIPTEETTRKASTSVDHLTKMMVRQQFEELGAPFQAAKYRDIDQPIRTAWEAFKDGHYHAAGSRLDDAHRAFLKIASSSRIPQSEIAEERFKTLLQGIRKIELATKQQLEATTGPRGATQGDAGATLRATPVEDLQRLQEIFEHDLDEMFPPGTSPEHKDGAKTHMAGIVSGPIAQLTKNLQALRHVTNVGAHNDAHATKDAREILKRLAKCSPQEIRPSHASNAPMHHAPLIDETDPEDGAITLSFSLTSTRRFAVKSVDMGQASLLEIDFRHAPLAPGNLRLQIYNAAGESILKEPEAVVLDAGGATTGHVDVAPEKIAAEIDDTRAILVEFVEVPEDVEIAKVTFK